MVTSIILNKLKVWILSANGFNSLFLSFVKIVFLYFHKQYKKMKGDLQDKKEITKTEKTINIKNPVIFDSIWQ